MQQASTTALPDQPIVEYPTRERQTPTEPTATVSRLRTVTGNRFPRKCACGCGFQIPRDPEVRYVVDFGGPRPYPAYLREHSPDYGTYPGKLRAREEARSLPGFTPASELPRQPSPSKPPAAPRPVTLIEVAHEDVEATANPSPEAGRPWASGQLVFTYVPSVRLLLLTLPSEVAGSAFTYPCPEHTMKSAATGSCTTPPTQRSATVSRLRKD